MPRWRCEYAGGAAGAVGAAARGAGRTDGGNRGHNLPELQLVQDGRLAGRIQPDCAEGGRALNGNAEWVEGAEHTGCSGWTSAQRSAPGPCPLACAGRHGRSEMTLRWLGQRRARGGGAPMRILISCLLKSFENRLLIVSPMVAHGAPPNLFQSEKVVSSDLMPIAPSANAFLRRCAAFQALINRRVCTKPPPAGARAPSRARSRKNIAPLGDGSALHDTPPMAWTAKQVGEWLATLGHSQHV